MGWKMKVRRKLNSVFEPMGFALSRHSPEIFSREMQSPAVRDRQFATFSDLLNECLDGFEGFTLTVTQTEMQEFASDLRNCPVRQTSGGGGFNAAMLLWSMAKKLQPSLIVESGVFRGYTSWVFRNACPKAEQFAFDISFEQLQHRTEGVQYFERDWLTQEIKVDQRDRSLIYFDDHVDQWCRIQEAFDRGFRYLIFDDNLPAVALHNDGEAAFPTVDMLFDFSLEDGQQIRWKTECGTFEYTHDTRRAEQTRELVKQHVRLPDLQFVFGYQSANLTLVELKTP
tara:strand:- start:101465 stop:102316 length:852 start_codon:yes stop_codon:yes gene_type:complete